MKATLFILCLELILVWPCHSADKSFSLPRSSPEEQGVSSADLLAFIEAADQSIDAMNSFMLVRHGHVVAEGWWAPYDAQARHDLYSLSKSFTSTAVGLAVAEGKLSIDDEVLKFFPEDAPAEPSANLKAMRVRDLLSMSAGHQDEVSGGPDTLCAKLFLAHPVPHKPGTHFKYNTPASFMLSAIVQKQTGQSVLEYLRPRLFEPLGIENPPWKTNWQGISLGGYGLRVRTEDIARFGQLYLQKGQWRGKSLLPAAWVEAATSRQTSNGSNPKSDWDQGYGYQFWRCRHHAYRGDGAFGQYCLVLPEQDAVVAITSGVKDMQAVLDLLWAKLLPAFHSSPLPMDRNSQAQLTAKLAHLSLPPAGGQATSPIVSIVLGRKFRFPENIMKLEEIGLEPTQGEGVTFVQRMEGTESRILCGPNRWIKGRSNWPGSGNEALAGSIGWITSDTCQIKLCFYESPFYRTMTLRFAGDQLTFDAENNVGFGPTKQPTLMGRTAE